MPSFTVRFQVEVTYEGRQKMTALSGCFAQLMHKAQSMQHTMNRQDKVRVFFNHLIANFHQEVTMLRAELVEARAIQREKEKETQQLMLQVCLSSFLIPKNLNFRSIVFSASCMRKRLLTNRISSKRNSYAISNQTVRIPRV